MMMTTITIMVYYAKCFTSYNKGKQFCDIWCSHSSVVIQIFWNVTPCSGAEIKIKASEFTKHQRVLKPYEKSSFWTRASAVKIQEQKVRPTELNHKPIHSYTSFKYRPKGNSVLLALAFVITTQGKETNMRVCELWQQTVTTALFGPINVRHTSRFVTGRNTAVYRNVSPVPMQPVLPGASRHTHLALCRRDVRRREHIKMRRNCLIMKCCS